MNIRFKLITILSIALTATTQAKSFEVQRWQTSNGTPVVFYQAMEVPMLDIQLAFAAGSAYDGEHFGLSTLTTSLMDQGNAGLSATTIAEQLAETGAQFNADAGRDMVIFTLRTLTEPSALNQSTETFTTILSKPDFPSDALEREKNQQLTAIKQSKESPDSVATLAFFEALYPNHPYGHPSNGTEETLARLSKEQVQGHYNHYFVARNAILVMVGAIDKEKAKTLAEKITAKLAKGSPAAAIPKAQSLNKQEKVDIKYPSSQTMIRLGQLGIDHHNPDYFPLMVGNYILGGGSLVSQLAIEVREKRGLTYGVYSQFIPMHGNGPFLISLSTQNSKAKEALDLTENILQEFLKNGANPQEIKAAKQYLTGSFPLSLASNSSIASMLLRMAFYHLPDDYLDTYIKNIESVNRSQIKSAFQKQVHPERMLQVTVGQM